MSAGYEVIGDTKMIIIVEVATNDVIGAAYAQEDDPRWWRGILRGNVTRLYVPAEVTDPQLDVARRLYR